MKLVTYQGGSQSGPQLGVVVDNQVINLAQASGGTLPNDMKSFLAAGDAALQAAQAIVAKGAGSDALPLDSVKLLAPISNPGKLIAIGLNYMDHVRETGAKVPSLAIMFTKYTSSIIGPGDAIRWDPAHTSKVGWEAELAVVIGKTAKKVKEEDAFDYIAGYMNCHDVSARDLQTEKGDQWIMGKSLDTFAPLGPYLVTKDEVPDPHSLSIKCSVNGELMQNSNTRELIYKIPHLISYLSRGITLNPGDIISTGTPDGVGMGRKPPVFLKNGDVVTVEVEGLGQLTNPCVEEPSA